MKSLKEALVHKHMDIYNLEELPLKYENIWTVGNVVTIKSDNKRDNTSTINDFIVVTKETCFPSLFDHAHSSCLLIDMKGSHWEGAYFEKDKFPYVGYSNSSEIIKIRGTILESEITGMTWYDDLKKLFRKYRLKYEKS